MFLKKIRSNKERMQKIAHFLAGFIILINAYDRFDTGNPIYLIYLFAGIFFIAVAVFLPFIIKKLPWANVVFFIIESSLSFVIAYEYFMAGKIALPYVYIAVGTVQLVLPLLKSRKQKVSKSVNENINNEASNSA
jgi:hypothetical protein